MGIQNRQKPCCDCPMHSVRRKEAPFCVVCGSKETKLHFHYIEGDYINTKGQLATKEEMNE